MVVRIAINGFGRIGRLVFRAVRKLYPTECQVVAIHDLFAIDVNIHLLKYDSAHGTWPEPITKIDNEHFQVGEGPTAWKVENMVGRIHPKDLKWGEKKVDVVLESTGVYKTKAQKGPDGKVTRDGYDGHIAAGAKKVVLSVPAGDEIECTLVLGVNDEDVKPTTTMISNASCTTNCLAPITKIINSKWKIITGFMTTVHAYTNDQQVADLAHQDMRRARAAAQNIIPTSTGAAKALPIVVHDLRPKSLDGISIRVPVITGSLVDTSFNVEGTPTRDEINAALKAATLEGPLKGILGYTEDAIVSSDIINCTLSSIVDSLETKVIPNPDGKSALVKVLSWYDNEAGYSARCADIFHRIGTM
uniref:Glyceraldehyde-3-phosphate dehydrogenase n=1 Tax=Spirotrichonympha leidyi TaxID=104089 RepID=A3KBF9_9EUKA|nr:glyceraldehyde-3-phosphate dehydrogenase [Spirotrichonympha leidyi]